jgi:2-hydroxy-3-oxopropionate reductase
MERVGLIGLGVMGRPMCRLLRKSEYPVFVHNRSSAAGDKSVTAGTTRADPPANVAHQCDVAITMLPDAAAVSPVIAEPDSLAETLRPGSLAIEMRPIAAEETRRLGETCG